MPGTIPAHIYFSLGLEMTLLVAFTGVPVCTITSMVTLLQYHRSTEKQLYIFSGPVEHEAGGPPVQKSGRKRLAKVQKCRTGSLSWTSEGLALLLHWRYTQSQRGRITLVRISRWWRPDLKPSKDHSAHKALSHRDAHVYTRVCTGHTSESTLCLLSQSNHSMILHHAMDWKAEASHTNCCPHWDIRHWLLVLRSH